MPKRVHVVPHNNGWAARVEGNKRVSTVSVTKQDAFQAGREKAIQMKTELIIHGKNGKIQNSNSYGNDPHPPKDKKH